MKVCYQLRAEGNIIPSQIQVKISSLGSITFIRHLRALPSEVSSVIRQPNILPLQMLTDTLMGKTGTDARRRTSYFER
jgi:hypothetical protein